MQTMTGDYELVVGATVDLCSTYGSADDDAAITYNDDDAAVAYNGDDAYNDYSNANAYGNANDDGDGDGDACPYDGIYPFSTNFTIPRQRNTWKATGWSASGQINMYTYTGNVIGTCNLKFSTTTTHRTPSSHTVFAYSMTVISVALFVCVFIGARRGSGFSRNDDVRMFHRLGAGAVQSTTSVVRRKKTLENDDLDTTFDTRATGDLDTSFDTCATHATTGTGTGTTFSGAWFA
jgi:hypothetical protein